MLSLARGRGPWVLKPGKPIESTWLTYEQLTSMLGMTTNAQSWGMEEFDRFVIAELDARAARALSAVEGPYYYSVNLLVTRLKPLARLCPADRATFNQYRGTVRRFNAEVTLDLPDRYQAEATAIRNTLARFLNPGDFDAIVSRCVARRVDNVPDRSRDRTRKGRDAAT